MDLIVDFIESTHVAVENVPASYGVFHLSFVVLSLLAIVTVCYLARKSNDKAFRIVLFSVGALLLLSEVYKQLYYGVAAGGPGYDWSIFPFQLCSVPMYLSTVAGCMKKCKLRDCLCEYLASIGLLGGIMAYIEPSGILNGHYFTLIHSCLWHALLIFIALYTIFTGNACNHWTDYKKALAVLFCVVVTATSLNIVFRSIPDFNMCYISPFYNTPLAVFSSFDVFFQGLLGSIPGRILSIAIYILALILGGGVLYIISWFARQKLAGIKIKSVVE